MTFDYYAGFEGEPELIIESRHAGRLRSRLRAWNGYLHEFMVHVPTTQSGWTGIALPYHLHGGWNEETEWIDPDVADTVEKVRTALRSLQPGAGRDFANALLFLLEEAIVNGDDVVWRLE